MNKVSEILSSARGRKKISIKKASRDLSTRREYLEAIENSQWQNLPEPPFAQGLVRSYATYLGLDAEHTLALFRREYDEAKYRASSSKKARKRFYLTPARFATFLTVVTVLVFIGYLVLQYLSVLSAPRLEIESPPDDLTTSIPVVAVSGKVEQGSVVAINGEFVAVDKDGEFIYQYKLEEGRNEIEIIASKNLSPKSKVVRIIRLIR